MDRKTANHRLSQLQNHVASPTSSQLGPQVAHLLAQDCPQEAAQQALRQFLAPPRYRANLVQQRILEQAETESIDIEGCAITTYIWNGTKQRRSQHESNSPGYAPAATVIISHGFGTSAAFVTPLIAHLLKTTSLRIVAVDMAAHGQSMGDEASLGHFITTLRIMATHPRNQPLAGIVGHSVGATAAVMLLAEFPNILDPADGGVLACINPPLQADTLMTAFCNSHGLPVIPSFVNRMLEHFVPRPEFVLNNRLGRKLGGIPVLIVQDENDHIAPIAQAEQLAVDLRGGGSRVIFERTKGLGHFKTIGDGNVCTLVQEFITKKLK